jgi:signal transduction histidine kinase
MTPDRRSDSTRTDGSFAALQRNRWFAGVTWKGLALVTLLAVLHALRRNSYGFFELPFADWLGGFGISLLTGLIELVLITLAVVATYNRAPSAPAVRYPALALAVVASSAIGTGILGAIESRATLDFFVTTSGSLWWWTLATWPRYALLGALLTAVFVYFRGAEESEAVTHQAELDRALFAQQMDEARLQMLQAQIEPHFLFNTLATVRHLYQTDSTAAESMLENLMRYLAVALPQMRASESTLGREVALAEAYLSIQQIRMGRRLGFAIEVPGELKEARLPPMMLLTLAENAIKHGLNPLPEGGFIRVSARVEQHQLRLEVADSGQGFAKTSGGGTGLANISARLAAMYGTAAQFSIGTNLPRGVTAIIGVPYAGGVPSSAAAT